jgi:cytoskeletal protein CcmA (bactofilin family)
MENPARHALHAGVIVLAVEADFLTWAMTCEDNSRPTAAANAQNLMENPPLIFSSSSGDYIMYSARCKQEIVRRRPHPTECLNFSRTRYILTSQTEFAMDTKDKKEILDVLTKAKPSFAMQGGKPHTIMPKADGRQLVVGKNIKLSGAIDVCESLVVEGVLEANMAGSKYLDIVYGGKFSGDAEVEEAHISGLFDGNLTVTGTLYVYSTGEVKGKINYAVLVVEKGGVLKGTLKNIESRPRTALD